MTNDELRLSCLLLPAVCLLPSAFCRLPSAYWSKNGILGLSNICWRSSADRFSVMSRKRELKNNWQVGQNRIRFLLQLRVVLGRYSRRSRRQRGHIQLLLSGAAVGPILSHALCPSLSLCSAESWLSPGRACCR